jgi:hypothetical protein
LSVLYDLLIQGSGFKLSAHTYQEYPESAMNAAGSFFAVPFIIGFYLSRNRKEKKKIYRIVLFVLFWPLLTMGSYYIQFCQYLYHSIVPKHL